MLLTLLALMVITAPSAAAGSQKGEAPDGRWYTFTWPAGEAGAPRPRGGTTEGPPVTPAEEPSPQWLALQADDLSPLERDRRAILALAGEYRTSFDFVETVTYVPGLARDRPYQSWATEYIFVLEEAEDLVSLQHVLVMHVMQEGRLIGPMVQKHWRQDWRHEADRAVAFLGDHLWQVTAVPRQPAAWTQTVFQVDDTPRYAATGRWVHHGNLSRWESERGWRPLPRREHTVRDDYQALETQHRISITPGGWTHEQDNVKVKLAGAGRADPQTPYLAREQGLARYTRITGYDFEPARAYWSQTEDYWGLVRGWWRERLARAGGFRLHADVNGTPLFVPLFEGAARAARDPAFDRQAQRDYLEAVLSEYVDEPSRQGR